MGDREKAAELMRLIQGTLDERADKIIDMGLRIRTLEDELAQAKADRDVLGAEVRAWRGDKEGDINAHAKIFVPYDDSRNFDAINQVGRWVKEAKTATDASGALSRAGGKQ